MRLNAIKKRFGDILVDVGIITAAQLQAALDIQKNSGGKLGAILARMGLLNEEVMLAFLGKQCGVPYISLAEYGPIDRAVATRIPESIIRYHTIIPISLEGTTITIAMADPFNVFALDDIKALTGFDTAVVIASEHDIRAAIASCFSLIPDAGNTDAPRASAGEPSRPETALQDFLAKALHYAACQVYLEPEASDVQVRYRIGGAMKQAAPLSKENAAAVVAQLQAAGAGKDARALLTINSRTVAVTMTNLPTIHGDRITLRVHPAAAIPDLAHLGLEPEALPLVIRHLEDPGGMIIIAGPPFAGKTTTAYAALAHLNYPETTIFTLEQQPSFSLRGMIQLALPTNHEPERAAVIATLLAEFPRVLFIGDVSTAPNARLAARAALDGATVIATVTAMHRRGVFISWDESGAGAEDLSRTLRLLVTQRLMRSVCPACRESYNAAGASMRHLASMAALQSFPDTPVELWRGRGCQHCNFSGYTGYSAIFELAEPATDHSHGSDMRRHETLTIRGPRLAEAAWRRMTAGVTTAEEFLRTVRTIA